MDKIDTLQSKIVRQNETVVFRGKYRFWIIP